MRAVYSLFLMTFSRQQLEGKKNVPKHFIMLRYVLNFATMKDRISVCFLLQGRGRNFKAADILEAPGGGGQGCSAVLIPFQLDRRRFLIKITTNYISFFLLMLHQCALCFNSTSEQKALVKS